MIDELSYLSAGIGFSVYSSYLSYKFGKYLLNLEVDDLDTQSLEENGYEKTILIK